jgi:hypothetical protein
MDVYKYQIWTGRIPGTEPPRENCLSGTVNTTTTTETCNCPPYLRLPGYQANIPTNFTGLFDYDRISGVTITTGLTQGGNPNPIQIYTFTPPPSALGGYQIGDIVVMDHPAIPTQDQRVACLNRQGPSCFIYIDQGYNPTQYNYGPNPAPWKSPLYPFDINLNTGQNVGTGTGTVPLINPNMGASNGPGGVGVGSESYGQWVCCGSDGDGDDPTGPITGSDPDFVDKNIPIFLDQDFNDMGFYTPFDGGIFHKDTFSNFVIQPILDMGNDGYWVTLTNSTPFGLYEDTQGFAWTIDWGDGDIQNLQYPTLSLNHEYTIMGNLTITVQMVAPWGITSMSQPITLPYYSGGTFLNIPNPNFSFTYNPPGGGPPVTQDWMYSTFGPLDSGTNIQQYVSTNYAPVPLTVTGITESQLSSFQTYSTAPSNSAFLPNGYFENQVVPLGGDVEMDPTTFTPVLYGEITNATSTFTAYTISDGGAGGGSPVYLFDYQNGTTLFEVDTIGLNQYSLFTQNCDPLVTETEDDPSDCDFCLGLDTTTGQNVVTNQGQWDPGTQYQPGDLVVWAGCCWFMHIHEPPGIPPNDPSMFEQSWWPCEGQNCTSTDIFTGAEIPGCINAAALNYNSLATVDDGSCIFDINTDPTTQNPLNNTDTYGDGLNDYGGAGTGMTPSAGCCDPQAINYEPLCAGGNVANDPTSCEYVGGNEGLWVCDPNNNLRLRCGDSGGGGIAQNCHAVQHPAQMQYINPTTLDGGVNCSNSVDTPQISDIDICQNGDGTNPGLDPTDAWGLNGGNYPNMNGGRGTGCVRIDKAWHPHSPNGQSNWPFGTMQNGGTAYGNYYYWELATIVAGNATGSGALYATINGQPALPPGNVPLSFNGVDTNNTVNPVVELTQTWQNFNLPGTYNSYCECMKEMGGCVSNMINYCYDNNC